MFLYFLVILRKKICFLPTLFFHVDFFSYVECFCVSYPKISRFMHSKTNHFSFLLFSSRQRKKELRKQEEIHFKVFFSCLKQKKKSGFLRKVFSCTNSFSTWFSTHATMLSCIFCSTHGKQTEKPSGKFYKSVFVFMFESEKKYFF